MEVVRFESEEGEETFVLIQSFSTLSILLSLRLLPVQYQSGPSCQTETKRILANQLDLGEALDILSSVLFIPKKKKMRMWRLIYLSLGCHGQLARIPTIYREMNPSTCFNFLNDKIYRCIKMLVKIYTYTHTLRRFDYTSIFRKGEEKKKLDERWSMKKIRMEFKVAKWMCF